MRFGFDEDQMEIQRTATGLLEGRSTLDRVREHAESRTEDSSLWKEMCELGWPGIAVAEENGGQGLGVVELTILLEQAGRTLACVPLMPSAAAALAIQHAGSAEQRDRWLPLLASGEVTGAVGIAEGGRCEIAAGAPGSAVAVLFDEEGGARLLDMADALVETVETIDPTRLYGSVEGPGADLPGDAEAALDLARVTLAAELTGVASRATEITVDYVKDRKQFDTPVGAYQAISHKCAEMYLGVESARSTAYHAAWAADASPEALAEAAAVAHVTAVDQAREVTASAIQAHGGIGFTWEADPHWFYKRAQLGGQLLGGTGGSKARLTGLVSDRLEEEDD